MSIRQESRPIETFSEVLVCYCDGPACSARCDVPDGITPKGWYALREPYASPESHRGTRHFDSIVCLSEWTENERGH